MDKTKSEAPASRQASLCRNRRSTSGAQLAAWDFLKSAVRLLPIGPRRALSAFPFCLLCAPAVRRGPTAATGAAPPPLPRVGAGSRLPAARPVGERPTNRSQVAPLHSPLLGMSLWCPTYGRPSLGLWLLQGIGQGEGRGPGLRTFQAGHKTPPKKKTQMGGARAGSATPHAAGAAG